MARRTLGVASALVDGAHVAGDVLVDGGVVDAVGVSPAGRGGMAVAGFVDLQVNGFVGVDFTDADDEAYDRASAALARTGVTTFLVTVPTTAPARYDSALGAACRATRRRLPGARVGGIHLEGPFLSARRRGAHRSEWLRMPDAKAVEAWMERAPVVLVTLAPELPGALELTRHLRAGGVVVSLGHTDATAAEAHAGFDAGASMVTHVWNAQRPVTARDPGVTAVALTRPGVAVAAICDLVHVAPDVLRLTAAAVGDRFVAVTDAAPVAGLAGIAEVRLDDGTLSGSSGTMDGALRNLVGLGMSTEAALHAVTVAPASALGPHGRRLGRLGPGSPADVVVLDDCLVVGRVLVAGEET